MAGGDFTEVDGGLHKNGVDPREGPGRRPHHDHAKQATDMGLREEAKHRSRDLSAGRSLCSNSM